MGKEKNSKIFLIIYIILIIISVIIYFSTKYNYNRYKQNIGEIIDVEDTYLDTKEVTYGYKEDYYKQTLKIKLLNNEYKNQEITIENEYESGGAYSEKYQKGNILFLNLNKTTSGNLVGSISGMKRDHYIVLITLIFILSIILVGRFKGLLAIISVISNILIFITIINLNNHGINIIFLMSFSAIIYCVIGLTLASGFNKNTLAAIISSLLGLATTMLIALTVMRFTNFRGVRFDQMELLTRPYKEIFISELLIAGLGAIMDISITITSAFKELINQNKKISKKELAKSGINIGKDVTGTMINVLFFTYICSVIPTLIILFRNGIPLSELKTEYISLEMVRALVGAIGITITIPIAIIISLLILRRNNK